MRYLYILLLLNALFSQPVYAIGYDKMASLSTDKTWLKLLHIPAQGEQSKITSSNFFLSAKGAVDAQAELKATLNVLDMVPQAQQLQVMCKFPARYFWLSKQLGQPHIKAMLDDCSKLQHWVGNYDELSLILVSGYLGNPASTFGHALLKLQSSHQNKKNMLMDAAINFGAITPEQEPTLTYVYKGITGGYKATFLDKYYYTQELMYSRLESRDMWVYTLNLSQDKTRLLMYHIWELIGQKFDYYFLDENCAYQLVDVLALVIDEPMVDKVSWYVPVEAFYRLEAIDKQYREAGKEGLIRSVVFLPSSQRKLNHRLSALKEDELKAMQLLMLDDTDVVLNQVISGLKLDSKINVLDAALDYYNYQYIKSGLQPSVRDKRLKRQILLARFAFPASQNDRETPLKIPSPTQGFAPMLWAVSAGYSAYQKAGVRLHWAAYHQSSTGKNNLNGDELVLLDTVLNVSDNRKHIGLEQLDFIRIRKLNNNQMMVRNHDWAWQMRVGVNAQRSALNVRYDGVMSFGLGKTWMLNKALSVYVMTDLSAHTEAAHMRLRPHLGVYSDLGKVKNLWYVGVENTGESNAFKQVWGGEMQYHTSKQTAVVFQYKSEETVSATMEIRWFW